MSTLHPSNHVKSLLDTLTSRSPKEVWGIEYKGQTLTLPNGKSHWELRRDAKSALTIALYRLNQDKGVHIALVLRALEAEGVVKYIKVFK